jgi:hypothetical protein
MVIKWIGLLAVTALVLASYALGQCQCDECTSCPCTIGQFDCYQCGFHTCQDQQFPCTYAPWCGDLTHADCQWYGVYCGDSFQCYVRTISTQSTCNGEQWQGSNDVCCFVQ